MGFGSFGSILDFYINFMLSMILEMNCVSAKMGSQVLVPFRGSEDSPRHLKIMGDLGQVEKYMTF